MRRILSLLLAALMVFGLFNAQVFAGDAAENTQTVTIVKQTGIAGVKIDGELVQGNTVDLAPGQHTAVAVPEDGYVFKQWKIGFSAINDAELTFNVPDVKRITITGAIAVRYFNFVDNEWQLLNTKYPNNKGQVTLLKEATANMVLNEWNTAEDGSGTSYTPGQSTTVTRSLDLYAQESPIAATRALRINAGRGVNRSTVTINGQKKFSLNAVAVGDRVTITATPSKPADYEISAWASIDYKYGATTYVSTDLENIDDDTPGVFSFDMPDANVAIQVSASMIGTRDVFIIPDDTIASVTGAGTYDINGEVTLTATPAEGYGTVYWKSVRTSVDDVACVRSMQHVGRGEEYSFSMPKYNLAFEVSAKPAEHVLTYVVDDATWRTVGFDTGATINAVKNPPKKTGFVFKEWNTESDGSGDPYAAGEAMTLTTDTTLYAIYEDPVDDKDYFVTVNKNGLGIKTVSGYTGAFKKGDTVTITATVYDGYENPIWTPAEKTVNGRAYSDQGVEEYTGYTCTFTMPANNVAFDLTAQPKRYQLYIDVQDGVNLTSATPNYAIAGSSVTVSAEPEEGYGNIVWQSVAGEFDGQTYNSMLLFSGSDTYTFTMPKAPVALRVSAKPRAAETYAITWENYDGSILKTDRKVVAGTTPSYSGTTPVKPATAEYEYVFAGWSPDIEPASADATYTATFTETARRYTITWLGADETEIYNTELEYGATAEYDTDSYGTPTKPDDDQYSYTFSAWYPTPGTVTEDTTYRAVFTAAPLAPPQENHKADFPTMYFVADPGVVVKDDIIRLATAAYGSDVCDMLFPAGLDVYGNQYEVSLVFDAEYTESKWLEIISFILEYPFYYVKQDGGIVTGWGYEEGANEPLNVRNISSPSDFTIDDEGNIYLYAQYKDAQYISFDFNGGHLSADAQDEYLDADAAFTLFAFGAEITNNRAYIPLTEELDDEIEDFFNEPYDLLIHATKWFRAWSTTPDETGIIPRAQTDDIDFDEIDDLNLSADGNVIRLYAIWQTTPTADVTWLNPYGRWGTSQLKKDRAVNCGVPPVYTGETPTREETQEASYTFDGWTTAADGSGTVYTAETLPVLDGDTTYYAHFAKQIKSYTVEWICSWVYPEIVYDTETYEYGETPVYKGPVPTYSDDSGQNYTFAGWNPEIYPVSYDQTYYAEFTTSGDITWCNWDGSVLEVDTGLSRGDPISYDGPTPTWPSTAEYDYAFCGWTTAGPHIVGTSDNIGTYDGPATYYASFFPSTRQYTITWSDWDGSTLASQDVRYGDTPSYTATPPQRPASAAYTYQFSGWSPAITSATGNTVYTAVYATTLNSYTVTWKNWDGTVLETDANVPYGSTPQYNGTTPVRTATASAIYTFSGWAPAVSPVTGDVIYTASFSSYRPGLIREGELGPDVTFRLYSDGLLEIKGSGDMWTWQDGWFEYVNGRRSHKEHNNPGVTNGSHPFTDDYITRVTIENGITSLGNAVFCDATITNDITIPNSVTSIDDNVFYKCSGFTSITLPESITSIGEFAFACTDITSVAIPNGVTIINTGVFSGCNDLAGVTIPDSVTEIGRVAFDGCDSLTSIVLPSGITSIGNGAFQDCTSLASINIPNGITVFNDFVFSHCTSLTNINIPSGTLTIKQGAFERSGLVSVTIPNGVTTIGDLAFRNCRNLTSAVVPGSVTSFSRAAFDLCPALAHLTFQEGYAATTELSLYGKRTESDNTVVPCHLHLTLPASMTVYHIYKDRDITIYAPAGSSAQQYAEHHNIPFVAN